jgi:anti-sigma regulatory factor (Ser/Thr protein kinase)
MARFTLTHSRHDMARLADWLDRQEQAMRMPDKVAFAVRQCLEEAVANLIDHTPPLSGETIAVELNWQDGMLAATVEDSGPPFDLRAAAPMVRATSLETVEPGGWGIHLIRAFANGISYETKAGRNCLTLRFVPPSAQATPTLTDAAPEALE